LGNVAFYGNFRDKKRKNLYSISLNSTFSILQTELMGRVNLGDGLLTTYGPDLKKLQVIDIEGENYSKEIDEVYKSLKGVEVKSIFEELGTENSEELDLTKVVDYRLKIDDLFLRILGYENAAERENILQQMYSATIKIIKKRLTKAKSQDAAKKQKKTVEFENYNQQLNELLLDNKAEAKETLTFKKELEKTIAEITLEKRLQNRLFDNYWRSKFGNNFDEKEVANENQIKMKF
jgi:hypothetical protein